MLMIIIINEATGFHFIRLHRQTCAYKRFYHFDRTMSTHRVFTCILCVYKIMVSLILRFAPMLKCRIKFVKYFVWLPFWVHTSHRSWSTTVHYGRLHYSILLFPFFSIHIFYFICYNMLWVTRNVHTRRHAIKKCIQ